MSPKAGRQIGGPKHKVKRSPDTLLVVLFYSDTQSLFERNYSYQAEKCIDEVND